MDGSPSSIITMGYGFSTALVVTLGYGSLTGILSGQWSNVIALQSTQPTLSIVSDQQSFMVASNQPTITLTGQEWVTLGSEQGTARIDLP